MENPENFEGTPMDRIMKAENNARAVEGAATESGIVGRLEVLTRYAEKHPGTPNAEAIKSYFLRINAGDAPAFNQSAELDRFLEVIKGEVGEEEYEKLVKGE